MFTSERTIQINLPICTHSLFVWISSPLINSEIQSTVYNPIGYKENVSNSGSIVNVNGFGLSLNIATQFNVLFNIYFMMTKSLRFILRLIHIHCLYVAGHCRPTNLDFCSFYDQLV